MLNVKTRHLDPDVVVLSLEGRLILGRDCQQVEWQLDDLLRENKLKVVLDLAGLDYIDSAGVGVVVMCFGKMKKSGGTLRVAGALGMVEETLTLTNVRQIIQCFPTVEAAAANWPERRIRAGSGPGG